MGEVLEAVAGEMLRAQELTLGLAESSTGGLLGHRLTEVPGSSDYFVGSIVPYGLEVQTQVVGVAPATIQKHGVVSEATAREMARGARRVLGADIGLSISGIAGVHSGRSRKPVGLTYIGLSAADMDTCERYVFGGDRSHNKWQSTEAALGLLIRYLDRRQKLPQLQHMVDRMDPTGAPQLALIKPAEDGIRSPETCPAQFSVPRRLGVLSSAFNPPTQAHMRMAALAMQHHRLAEVMFELSKVNVDKTVYGATLAERLWMLAHLARGRPRFCVGLCSHARFIDKARAIQASYPRDTVILFIVGYDTLVRVFDSRYYDDLESELRELFARCQFIVANRGQHRLSDVLEFLAQPACRPFSDRMHAIELDPFHAGLSSTQVRERLAQRLDITGMVPEVIARLLPLTALGSAEPSPVQE